MCAGGGAGSPQDWPLCVPAVLGGPQLPGHVLGDAGSVLAGWASQPGPLAVRGLRGRGSYLSSPVPWHPPESVVTAGLLGTVPPAGRTVCPSGEEPRGSGFRVLPCVCQVRSSAFPAPATASVGGPGDLRPRAPRRLGVLGSFLRSPGHRLTRRKRPASATSALSTTGARPSRLSPSKAGGQQQDRPTPRFPDAFPWLGPGLGSPGPGHSCRPSFQGLPRPSSAALRGPFSCSSPRGCRDEPSDTRFRPRRPLAGPWPAGPWTPGGQRLLRPRPGPPPSPSASPSRRGLAARAAVTAPA